MRLKHIKLAGFKSFVDATTIKFPDPMTAIVGPNGCGKSNVIDAVRWVLGESSAKNLRGDAMSDVIFNGASQRKPVSQASVELLFSDAQGRLSGSLAERNEVAIKRVVNRDGQNQYYLNGSKCRRRDVVDIFLGTGLGPRSYAIIEQGMISRLIESKPKDLRIFIDEAAGISKYKERRRETEIRLRHTEENLERLQDIQHTLQEQVEKLANQAEQAKEYKALRQQERELQQQIWIAKWQGYQAKLEDLNAQISALKKLDVQVETELNELNARWEVESQQLRDNESQQHDTQQTLLGLTQQCAKLEQQLQHQLQQQKQAEQQQQAIIDERQMLQTELASHQRRLQECLDKETELAPHYALCLATQDELNEQHQQQLEHIELAQSKCDQAKEDLHQLSLQQQRVRSEHDNLLRQQEHFRQLLAEQQSSEFDIEGLQATLSSKQTALAQIEAQLEESQQNLTVCEGERQQLEQEYQQAQELLKALDADLHQRNLRIVSLQSQQSLLEQNHSQSLLQHLEANQVQFQHLWSQLNVQQHWQKALETVLSAFSAGLAVNAMPEQLENANFALLTGLQSPAQDIHPNSLLAQITEGNAPDFLNKIGLTASLSEARTLIQQTNHSWHSVVTPEGDWLGRNWWMRGNAYAELENQQGAAATLGFFERKQQLEQLQLEQTAQEQHQGIQHQKCQQCAEQNAQIEQQLQDQQQQHRALLSQKQSIVHEVALAEQSLLHEQKRQQALETAAEKSQQQLDELSEQLALTDESLTEFSTQHAQQTEQKAEFQQQLEQLKQQEQRLKQQLTQAQQQVSEASLQQQDVQWQKKNAEQRVAELDKQLQGLARRETEIQQRQSQDDNAEVLEARLQEELERKLTVEQQLQHFHHQAQVLDEQRQTTHTAVQRVEVQMKHNAEKQQRLNVEHERQNVLQETVFAQLQQIDNGNVDLATPVSINVAQAEKRIQRLQQQVREMGPVNLAAIAEYESQSEKLLFMQQQHRDLSVAVETLQKAIQKIDRETRQRFKETFDKINAGLQELFPKVFAGGSAWLALSEEEDVLDAGVHIMARPPGKKNATIHLLSGGEKALTALSLVFAIFRLNPAPFCLLDEVDAPLDDANVGRFCNLVQEMSHNVQFIYISHNKVAMEMAAQLIGVTMYEPGVSRVVAVDVAEALQFADS